MTDTTARTRAPETPAELSKSTWRDTLKRTVREFKEDDLTLLAAALTYYAVLSLFPALLVLLALLGLAGTSTIDTLLQNLGSLTPSAARDVVTNAVHDLQGANSKAGFALVAGLLGALWSASGYIGAFMKASNVIYEVEEGRKFWKLKPLQIAATVVIMILTTVIVVAIVVTGPVAERVGNIIGAGDTAVTVFNIVKWPVIALIVSQIFAFLYWVGPNVKQPGFRWISPGGVLAVVLWVLASAAFAFYVAKFGSYSKTYGSMAAAIIFLVWLWLTNVVMLLGAEFNAEVERGRQIEAGHPPDREPFLPHREAPKQS
ncbi:MAG: YihY/virulence factor BrkB family protein [Actinomycetota bacterium]|nr:YihY/virulence factor BrkB family protein [Actinomycetota bacterium]